jgi:hypothetical protein
MNSRKKKSRNTVYKEFIARYHNNHICVAENFVSNFERVIIADFNKFYEGMI